MVIHAANLRKIGEDFHESRRALVLFCLSVHPRIFAKPSQVAERSVAGNAIHTAQYPRYPSTPQHASHLFTRMHTTKSVVRRAYMTMPSSIVQPKTVLLATEKAFAEEAVDKIEAIFKRANYTLRKLENYKTKSDLMKAIADVDAVIVRSDIIDQEVVDKASNVKIVVRAGAGYDNIDLTACTGRGIVAMNTPGQNANAVAELVFAMMLVSARNNFDGTSGFELRNRSIALFGFGAVANAVLRLAQGFGMRPYVYTPTNKDAAITEAGATPLEKMEDLFKHDYVSVHIPLTESRRGCIDKSLLSALPKGGTLINTARPELMNEEDLLEFLKERPDFRYLSDVAPANAGEMKDAVGDAYMKRLIFTEKKMGAQTLEANNNAGVAAANQIVNFFERGDTRHQIS